MGWMAGLTFSRHGLDNRDGLCRWAALISVSVQRRYSLNALDIRYGRKGRNVVTQQQEQIRWLATTRLAMWEQRAHGHAGAGAGEDA